MQGGGGGGRGRGGSNPLSNFDDPFAGFGGFGGFGGHGSLLSGFLGGRDPFDDPFFTRPLGGMFGPSLFPPMGNPFGGNPFGGMNPSGLIAQQAPEPRMARGPIIEEINSDDENEDADEDKKENPRKHGRLGKGPYIEDPEDKVEEKKSKHLQHQNDYRIADMQSQPQTHSFTFQSSTVTYGGANGASYTSSKTRRTGSDGFTFEEDKEADTASGQATHKIARGLHSKGHSLTRKLNSDGKVDQMQMLHNLEEDELPVFEEAWNGNAQKHLPGWTGNLSGYGNAGASSRGQIEQQGSRGGWALPSTEPPQQSQRVIPDTRGGAASRPQQSGQMKAGKDKRSDQLRGRGRGRN
ncbi:hypothetical protein UlMin_042626 [Ulmus minor]